MNRHEKLNLLKEIRNETGLPYARVKFFLEKETDPVNLRQLIQDTVFSEITSVADQLDIGFEDARAAYFEYGCSVERCLLKGAKNEDSQFHDQKKDEIWRRLERGWQLLGLFPRTESEDYRWAVVKKLNPDYELEVVTFSKRDIEEHLDLLYSDAKEYRRQALGWDSLLTYIEQELGVEYFDIDAAYKKFPL